jgi:hypothetical protein
MSSTSQRYIQSLEIVNESHVRLHIRSHKRYENDICLRPLIAINSGDFDARVSIAPQQTKLEQASLDGQHLCGIEGDDSCVRKERSRGVAVHILHDSRIEGRARGERGERGRRKERSKGYH